MDTRHLVDPELVALLERLPAFSMSDATLPLVRKSLDASIEAMTPGADGLAVTVEERVIDGAPGQPDVRVLVVRPSAARAGRIGVLHVHGGGYVIGSPEQFLPAIRRMSHELDAVVVSVDYRLAPETAYPGPLDDCGRALEWFAAQAVGLGVDTSRIGVMGDSAGGGLAAALALRMRDEGGVPLAFASLMYPMLDDRTAGEPSAGAVTGQFVWTRESNRFGWRSLLGGLAGSEDIPPYAAPARATDLSRLPPAWIGIGALDLFLDEGCDFALRLAHAGVPVELHVLPGAFHGFAEAVGTRLADRLNAQRLDAIRRLFDTR